MLQAPNGKCCHFKSTIFGEDILVKKLAKVGSTVLGVLIACGSAQVHADNCKGEDVLVTRIWETTDLGGGHTTTVWQAYSQLVSDFAPYHGTTGDCSGAILTTPDGKTQSMGYCARRDKDGDTYSLSWHQGPGADKGMWKATGGTGKFAGKQNSGWYETAWADGAMSGVTWGGTCK